MPFGGRGKKNMLPHLAKYGRLVIHPWRHKNRMLALSLTYCSNWEIRPYTLPRKNSNAGNGNMSMGEDDSRAWEWEIWSHA